MSLYDALVGSLNVVLHIFFREIIIRNSYYIPEKGPVIFVAAPHANQVNPSL